MVLSYKSYTVCTKLYGEFTIFCGCLIFVPLHLPVTMFLVDAFWTALKGIFYKSEKGETAIDTESTPLVKEPEFDFEDWSSHSKRSLTADYHSYESSSAPLKLCGLLVMAYLIIGIIAFSFVFEKWPVVYSAYFSVSTFTTIGNNGKKRRIG